MIFSSNALARAGVAAVIALGISQQPVAADTVRGCRNPAGQVRLIDETESCRPQETLVTWNTQGEPGPAGPEGPAGPGVAGGGDHSAPGTPDAPPPFTPLTGSPTSLTTENIATGFPAYMVWANVGIEFNSGNPGAGIFPSLSSANCQLVYTVQGRPGTFFIDGRSVSFPTTAISENNRAVRFSLGLNGLVGRDLTPALNPSEVVDVSLNCSSNGTPAANQIPVKALNFSLTGIGINRSFLP